MLFPLSCDAPIYHWPFTTVGLIVVNVAAFFAVPQLLDRATTEAEVEAIANWLLLAYGNGLHPVQWLTSIFMHAGWMHLIGNMVFLWIFGLVVEGKLGWWKFLLVYLGIGVTQSAIEQTLMLASEGFGFSLGASSAIYGLMAIAFIWAPKNEINCFYWFAIWAMGTIDVPIMYFALFYLAFDLLYIGIDWTSTGSVMGTGMLHVMGALVGVPVGLYLLKTNQVDCEGWDLLHVWNGAESKAEPDYRELDAKIEQKKKAKQAEQAAAARQQFVRYLNDGNPRAAATLYRKMKQAGTRIPLERSDLVDAVRQLHAQQAWTDSAMLLHELVERYPDGADPARLKLAQICVTELQKPARALELLHAIDFSGQTEANVRLAKKIARRAKALQAEGIYELDDDVW